MDFSPVILFSYNRPEHTQKVLDSLAQNAEANETRLFIFCDGPKPDASPETLQTIKGVRQIARRENRFKEVIIKESELNKGLANSIFDGVSEILGSHETVVVLEDDIVVGKGFLKYMNEALDMYASDDKVGCIHGWNYNLDTTGYSESTFFLAGADCWGWATWKKSWNLFNSNGADLLKQIRERKCEFEFDRRGTHNFTGMLEDQIAGKNNSWAIRWHASLFLQNKFCLQPVRSIVTNIGLDGSGEHCGTSDISQNPVDFIDLRKIPVKEEDFFFQTYSLLNAHKHNESDLTQKQKITKYINGLLFRFRK